MLIYPLHLLLKRCYFIHIQVLNNNLCLQIHFYSLVVDDVIAVCEIEVAIKGSMKRERLQLKALQAISNQSEAISEHIICRRAELLVRATYILTGW